MNVAPGVVVVTCDIYTICYSVAQSGNGSSSLPSVGKSGTAASLVDASNVSHQDSVVEVARQVSVVCVP